MLLNTEQAIRLWKLLVYGESGVGKTHLAEQLCRILPDAIYAKQGCGRPDTAKTQHFFRTAKELAAFMAARRDTCLHLVVESNTLARRGVGDLILFLEPHAATPTTQRSPHRNKPPLSHHL